MDPIEEQDERDERDEREDGEEVTHPLGDFLSNWEGKSGIYFISPYFDESQPDNMCQVKVGMSKHRRGQAGHPDFRKRRPYGGLGRRLDSYLLCYVQGFYVYAVLECKREKVYEMEKYFHQYFTGKNLQVTNQHSHREEWFMISRADLFTTINATINTYPNVFQNVQIFNPMPRFVDTNGRLAANPKKSMSDEQKFELQSVMPPKSVPRTITKRPRPDYQRDDDPL